MGSARSGQKASEGAQGGETGRVTGPGWRRFALPAAVAAALLLVAGGAWLVSGRIAGPREAPEAKKVLEVQAGMPFQILIPAYIPRPFDRAGMEISVNQSGPGGEPMVQLTYRTKKGATFYVRQWVPVNPDMEVLANSRPVQTKWGKGWLLKQGESLAALWVDIGPLRVSTYTNRLDVVPRETLLAMAETLGPASNRQVFSFVVEQPEIREIPPPPPVEIPVNEKGVQELTLVVTPGGYSPLRFAVRKNVPVQVHFRSLGEVGCGKELIFPSDPANLTAVNLASEKDKKSFEFTPRQAGQFPFYCSHRMYRGIMTVRD